MVVYTVLGSCISACVRDPPRICGVGGMNHFMLPAPKEHQSGDAWGGESTRYGSFAMEQLINEILKRGGMKHRLEVKLGAPAGFMTAISMSGPGIQNGSSSTSKPKATRSRRAIWATCSRERSTTLPIQAVC